MSDYTALRAALAAGPTAGPWVASHCGVTDNSADYTRIILSANILDAQRKKDAAYVAAADPQTIAALLAELDDARRDAGRLRGALEVSQAATAAAISKSQFQASTNAELNQQADTIRRLKADPCGLLNDGDAAMKGKP